MMAADSVQKARLVPLGVSEAELVDSHLNACQLLLALWVQIEARKGNVQ